MNKTTATVFIVIFGNLLVLAFGAAQVLLFPLLRSELLFMLAAAAVLIAHTLAAKLSRRRLTRYVSAKRYILCGTLPALILSVLVNIISYIFIRNDIAAFSGMYIDGLSFEWIFSFFAAGYSAAFLAAQFVVLAREIW